MARSRLRSTVAAVVLAIAAWAFQADPLAAASPGPPGGDARTTSAPGLVGDPLFAIAGVLAVGLITLVVTLLALRLAGPPHHRR